MRHFVCIRSIYGAGWSLEENRRRLALTAGVTVRTLAAQSCRDFELSVVVNPQDPLLHERLGVFGGAGVKVTVFPWDGTIVSKHAHTQLDEQGKLRAGTAVAGYRFDWGSGLALADGPTLTTRLDDDDGLHPTTLERVQRAAEGLAAVTALMHPVGFRVFAGRQARVRHDSNAFFTLFAPDGDASHVYAHSHARARKHWRVVTVDEEPAWLWVRHRDTLSGCRGTEKGVTGTVRRMFPVDWGLLS